MDALPNTIALQCRNLTGLPWFSHLCMKLFGCFCNMLKLFFQFTSLLAVIIITLILAFLLILCQENYYSTTDFCEQLCLSLLSFRTQTCTDTQIMVDFIPFHTNICLVGPTQECFSKYLCRSSVRKQGTFAQK